jgi:hypothetical protein
VSDCSQGGYGVLTKLHYEEPSPCCHRCEPLHSQGGWQGYLQMGNNPPMTTPRRTMPTPTPLFPLPRRSPCCAAAGNCSQTGWVCTRHVGRVRGSLGSEGAGSRGCGEQVGSDAGGKRIEVEACGGAANSFFVLHFVRKGYIL